jgi:chemotaxis protein MotB
MNSHALDDNHEGSYLESLSDLFVGFLFIFILFLMLFALLLAQAQHKADTVTANLTDSDVLRTMMLREIERSLRSKGIPVVTDERNGIVRLPESLLFDSGSAELRADGRQKLEIVARELRAVLPCYAYGIRSNAPCSTSSHPILDAMFIEGHTDNVQFHGGGMDNYDLSAQRAKVTFQTLRVAASDIDRLTNESGNPLLSISAYGPDRPLNDNRTDAQRRANRRIDIRFIISRPKTTI